MSSSLEKSVKGGTKVKLAPPKSKYVEHILTATQSEAGVAEVFRTLTLRLRDSTWTVAFKSLILVHLMIKEGVKDTTLSFLSAAPSHRLAVNNYTDVQTQGQNIRTYSTYLVARAKGYQATKCDYVRSGDGRMKQLSVDKGLLRETEFIQDQIKALVKCELLTNDAENEISLTAFRLLTRDLLDLFNVENEAVMNVLSRYFEMARSDAERAIKIYKNFCKQTDQVVKYLAVARQYEHATRLEIPKIKHAPTSLVASLQEYLDDKDFEINRRQYLAEQEAKKLGKPISRPPATQNVPAAASTARAANAPDFSTPSKPAARGPAPDLIDFFESIEQNQQTMAQQPGQSVDWFQQAPPQQFQQVQPAPPQQTGQWPQQQQAFPQQPIQTGQWPQAQVQSPYQQQQQQQQPTGPYQYASQQVQSPIQQQPTTNGMSQSTNPFRQSMMPTGDMSALSLSSPPPSMPQQAPSFFPPSQPPQTVQTQATGTNPFAKQQPGVLKPQQTGTNPFARNAAPSPSQSQSPTGMLQAQPTGSTNPFRQSMFVNAQTQQGWQRGPQGTMGGLEQLDTIAVFPRPGDSQAQPQQSSPWT